MREIKFRGMTVVMNGKPHWVYGYYTRRLMGAAYPDSGEIFNFNYDYIEIYATGKKMWVDPKSIGEFTGLKDKNGKEIYEGDIVKFQYDSKSFIGKIEYVSGQFQEDREYSGLIAYTNEMMEIIGNIYENGDLLK